MADSVTKDSTTKSKRGIVSTELVDMRCRMSHLCLNWYWPILHRIHNEMQLSTRRLQFEDDFDFLAPSYTLMDQILKYHSRQVRANYATHLKMHFHEYIFRAMNICLNKKSRITDLKDHAIEKQELLTQFKLLRENIIDCKISEINFDLFENPERNICRNFKDYLESHFTSLFVKDENLFYSQKVHPMKLLSHAIFITKLVRAETDERGNPCSIPNCLPLTDSVIPQHFRVDTKVVLGNFFKKEAMSEAQDLESKISGEEIFKNKENNFTQVVLSNTEQKFGIPYLTEMLDASNLLKQITPLKTHSKLMVFQFHLFYKETI
ncbi:hypothetical protein GEMRC1_010940 [Eukaryota sp. GEM-RC1]